MISVLEGFFDSDKLTCIHVVLTNGDKHLFRQIVLSKLLTKILKIIEKFKSTQVYCDINTVLTGKEWINIPGFGGNI